MINETDGGGTASVDHGGRPSVADAEAHFEAAWTLYLKGTTSGSAVARELKLSPQAGADLVKRVRNSFAEKSLQDDSFKMKRQVALARAEHLLAVTWSNYKLAYSPREKSAILKSVLATLQHITDLNGLTSKLFFQMAEDTMSKEEESLQMKKKLGLTDEDFDYKHYPETVKKTMNYWYEQNNETWRITKIEMEDPNHFPFEDLEEAYASGRLLRTVMPSERGGNGTVGPTSA